MSNNIKKEINTFFRKSNVNAQIVHINDTFNTGRFFSHKGRQVLLLQSNVVYKINCSCGECYIGQTKQNLITRLNDHNPNFSKSK